MSYGLSIQSWPSGHAKDSEEAIKFTQLEGIDCLIEKFPIDKANDAYSESILYQDGGLGRMTNCLLDAMLSGKVRFRSVIVFE